MDVVGEQKEMLEYLMKLIKDASLLINENIDVELKGNQGDLVTNFDFEIEKYITNNLKKKYPNFDMVSEEFNACKELTKNCFVLDPIDGTINFANNLPLWAIQLAVIKDGEPYLSFIYIPRINDMFIAVSGGGAYRNGKRFKISEEIDKNSIITIDGGNVDYRGEIIKGIRPYCKHYRRLGSAAVSFSQVASGHSHLYLFVGHNVWDYVPGVLLCKEAGAYIYDDGVKFIAVANNQETLDAFVATVYKNERLLNS